MSIYIYKAKRGPKEIVSGELKADSEAAAISRIESMGMVPVIVSVKEAVGHAPEPDKHAEERLTISPVNHKPKTVNRGLPAKPRDIDVFTRQLATLVKTNVPMLRSLALIADETESKGFRSVVADLERQVKEGKMLSEAMECYPIIFDNLYLNMVKSGEKGGVLDEILRRLAEHREKAEEIRRKIQAAMAYPALMIIVGIITIFVMLTYFLPKLTGLFTNMKQALPLPTKILIGLSGFMSANWYWFLIVIIFAVVVLGRVKPGSKKKLFFDMLKLHIPVIKKLVKNGEVAKFSRSLELLLKNGIPIYESLELAIDTLDNDALRERLGHVREDILGKGSTLSESLKRVDIFPKFAINMIAVGEESGKLDDSLTEIGDAYEREIQQAIKLITTLLEPLLILAVGAIVGFIVFAMLLPIFDIGAMGG